MSVINNKEDKELSTEIDKNTNRLFPVFLKVDQIQTLIVGGGNVGLEKLTNLLKNDPYAKIKLIGRSIKEEVRELAANHKTVVIVERDFSETDLRCIDLLILATEKRETNIEIRNLAKERGILTNVADTPDLCDFYLGSTVTKGNLKVGISTNGKSPTFAKRFRELLEDIIPDDITELLDNLRAVRDHLKGNFEHKVQTLNNLTKDFLKNKN